MGRQAGSERLTSHGMSKDRRPFRVLLSTWHCTLLSQMSNATVSGGMRDAPPTTLTVRSPSTLRPQTFPCCNTRSIFHCWHSNRTQRPCRNPNRHPLPRSWRLEGKCRGRRWRSRVERRGRGGETFGDRCLPYTSGRPGWRDGRNVSASSEACTRIQFVTH
jgi:hypothetical protein